MRPKFQLSLIIVVVIIIIAVHYATRFNPGGLVHDPGNAAAAGSTR